MSQSQKDGASAAEDLRKTSYLWIFHAGMSGLTFALGNVVFGMNCSQHGVLGGGFPGPASLLMVCIYKFFAQLRVKRATGYWVDKTHSNYYKKVTSSEAPTEVTDGDEFRPAAVADRADYAFNWRNMAMVFFAQAMTSLAGLCLVAYAFKFAKMAGINQGCIPVLFSMTIIYVSVLFYYCFQESISVSKVIGILLMLPCIVFLSMGAPDDASAILPEYSNYTEGQQQLFAILSVTFALIAPFFWTTKMYFLRLSEDVFKFNLFDVAVDAQIYQNAVASLMYLAYVTQFEFRVNELIEGSVTAVFFVLGDVFRSLAFRYGPGGPINALVGTQVIYQTLLNAVIFHQVVTPFQYYGITFGMVATVVISAGDEILAWIRGDDKAKTEEREQLIGDEEAESADTQPIN